MTMIERVARAMVAADSGPEGSMLFDIHLAEFGDGYRKSARAAIEAMREPTEVMANMGWDTAREMVGKYGFCIGGETPVWQTMIDAALKEEV